jgi:hypothetical protein
MSRILEAANGSDDVQTDFEMGGNDTDNEELPALEQVDDTDDEDEVETEEEKLSKSTVYCH